MATTRTTTTILWICAAASTAPGLAQADPGPLTLQTGKLEVTAHWESLVDTKYGFEQRALVRDLAPAEKLATYAAPQFQPLLPTGTPAVGDCWRLDAKALLPFLRQLHRGARLELHHDGGFGIAAPGAWACVRALDHTRAEIAFRVHAEFAIAGDGEERTSSFFTPSQFRGRIVVDRREQCVIGFQLAVPPASANVDINLAEGEGVIADIGRIPRLELLGGVLPEPDRAAQQISAREADERLERRFYPSAAIGWQDLAAARADSLASGKPLHVVALFGSLHDESC